MNATPFSAAELRRWENIARTVTIRRDRYGVPHITAPTDAGVVFGLMYAQAEDNFWQIEEDYLHSLGLAAEVYGDSAVPGDVRVRLYEVERFARAGYRGAGPRMRALYDAFAAGLNFYLATHPAVHPRRLARFEPWHALASELGAGPVDSAAMLDTLRRWRGTEPGGLEPGGLEPGGPAPGRTPGGTPVSPGDGEPGPDDVGSNMWAIAPAKSTSGHALLFINPHVGFFGGGQRYELHLESGEGWRFSGFAILGTPIPRTGHNGVLGWSHTNNYADARDLYVEHFDDPSRPLSYRYGSGRREAVAWQDSVRVRRGDQLQTMYVTLRKTHHGPIVAQLGPLAIAVRRARATEGGSIEQRYLMAKARTFAAWRRAMERRAIVGSNTMYADRAGTIYYVHGNAIPRRAPGVDPTRALDGADPRTEWLGYFTLDELPHVRNPKAGYIINTNSSPFHATADGENPDSAAYPSYVAPEPYNARARQSQRLLRDALAGGRTISLADLERLGFDRHVFVADSLVPALAAAWDALDAPERAHAGDSLAGPVDTLRRWNRVSDTASVAMTLFVMASRAAARERTDSTTAGAAAHDDWLDALGAATRDLTRRFGTWQVPWGEINRLQRVHTSGREPFSDARPSIPVRGGPPALGIIFAFNARPERGQRRLYGTSGNSYVSVVEFAPVARQRSVLVLGESADPASPHATDQASLYATGHMKDVPLTRADVVAATERTYRPGRDEPPPASR